MQFSLTACDKGVTGLAVDLLVLLGVAKATPQAGLGGAAFERVQDFIHVHSTVSNDKITTHTEAPCPSSS